MLADAETLLAEHLLKGILMDAPGLSLTGVRLIIPDHAVGLPVLRALSLCTCRRQYPGAAAGRNPRSSHPTVSAFPGSAAGSACTSTFSRSHGVWIATGALTE